MQPSIGTEQTYMGTEPGPSVQAQRRRPSPGGSRADLRNLVIIAGGFLLLVLLLPPQHEYAVIDDYLYAGSVRDMLNTGRFVMPDMSQANLVGQTLWGALWAGLFGFSFTTLTYSTLTMALACLLAFYGTARAVGVSRRGALLGTALLGFNPIFLHLSYSFMTDVPFLALTLMSCLCYIKGVQSPKPKAQSTDKRALNLGLGTWYLLLGGLFAGWAFLIRQYGVLVPAAFLGYLGLEGLASRRWRRGDMLLVALVPAAIFAAWYVWSRQIPPTRASLEAAGRSANFVFKEPWLRVFLLRAFCIMPLTALCAWGAVRIPKARWWLVPLWGLVFLLGMPLVDLPTEKWIAVDQPTFTARLGPLSYDLPDEPFSFAAVGNIIQLDGIDFDEFAYPQQPVWSMEAWRALFMFGVLLSVLLWAGMTSRFRGWLRSLRRRPSLSPLAGVYLFGALMFVVSLAFPGDLFDRYTLGFVPFFILFVVRGSSEWGRRAWIYSLAALAIVGVFSVLANADYMDHNSTRWRAAHWMEARVGAVGAGWNWDHWGHQDSDTYRILDIPIDGFRTERQFPYTCRLCGFTTRYVLAQSRADMPPLPNPAGAASP